MCFHRIEGVLLASPGKGNSQPEFLTDYDYRNPFIKPFTCITETAINIQYSKTLEAVFAYWQMIMYSIDSFTFW